MQFIYHKSSGNKILNIDGDLNKYLFKIKRLKKDKNIYFRNLKDNNIYKYSIINIGKVDTQLQLISYKEKIIKNNKLLHIGWCIVDPKTIEKTIASLNELGITKISFIYCQYSQKQFKINFDKLERLLINSSQQCGRSDLMNLEIYDSLDIFLKDYPKSYMFNFSNNKINKNETSIDTLIIGCEGGFSNDEINKINLNKIIGIENNFIMRSETAILSIASKILF
jgi:16S rRNA (uracil1498-N3)-methyltransferase